MRISAPNPTLPGVRLEWGRTPLHPAQWVLTDPPPSLFLSVHTAGPTPDSLCTITAQLISHGAFSVDAIYGYLGPPDEAVAAAQKVQSTRHIPLRRREARWQQPTELAESLRYT